MRIENLKLTYTHGGDVEWEAEWTDDDGYLHSDYGIVQVTTEDEVLPGLAEAVRWLEEKLDA